MKKIISLLCAVVLSFLLANGITFLFERPVGYIYTFRDSYILPQK